MSEENAGPPVQGWYTDPYDAKRLRWWDGSSWTDHTHPAAEAGAAASQAGAGAVAGGATGGAATTGAPAQPLTREQVAAQTAAPTAPSGGAVRDWLSIRSNQVLVAIVAIALGLFVYVMLSGGDEGDDFGAVTTESGIVVPGSEAGGEAPAGAAGGSAAENVARNAQTAIETFAADQDGSYADATTEALVEVDPSLGETSFNVTADKKTYTISATTESGTVFSITRDKSGATTYVCSQPGTDDCPENGIWAG